MTERKREVSVCVCVCVCERERERGYRGGRVDVCPDESNNLGVVSHSDQLVNLAHQILDCPVLSRGYPSSGGLML